MVKDLAVLGDLARPGAGAGVGRGLLELEWSENEPRDAPRQAVEAVRGVDIFKRLVSGDQDERKKTRMASLLLDDEDEDEDEEDDEDEGIGTRLTFEFFGRCCRSFSEPARDRPRIGEIDPPSMYATISLSLLEHLVLFLLMAATQQQQQQQQQQHLHPSGSRQTGGARTFSVPSQVPVSAAQAPAQPVSAAQDALSVILVTAGYDHTIRFWEAWSGICSRTIQHPDSQVNRLAISPDKRFLAAAANMHVRLYDVAAGGAPANMGGAAGAGAGMQQGGGNPVGICQCAA